MLTVIAMQLVVAILSAAGWLIFASCVYLLTLALASFLHNPREKSSLTRNRVVVLVPAHNEEHSLGECLASLACQTYPRRLRRVVVIADNCTDRTADVARAHGAQVMVREDPEMPGKGRALRWAFDQLLAGRRRADVFVVVDADSVADPDLLRQLEAEIATGAEVAQADYRVLQDAHGHGAQLVGVGFLLFHRTRFSGRAALGLPANLVGNGMAFKRQVLERVPWSAFTAVEDLEYSLMLRLATVRPVFTARAVVHGPVPHTRKALRRQRMRWEGGRLFLLSTWIGPLLAGAVRRRDWALLDAAVDLAILPTGLLALTLGLGFFVALIAVIARLIPAWVISPWALAMITLPAYVIIGLRSADAPPTAYRALLSTPIFLLRKLFLYARMLAGFDPRRWESAAIDGGADHLRDPDGDGKAWIAGVPVEVVDMDGAVNRVMSLVGRPEGAQVCTVNLDFVVSAQRDPEVGRVLRQSDLNIADGAPITWLAELLGHRMPRVAGADLVPLIVGAAADRGAPVFFLGGEGSAAEESARRLRVRYPSLTIAGCYEPPRVGVEDLPSAEMVKLIGESGAAIVLVGLGHPKQERWIARNRSALGSSVAIGVGGCFDFVSARRLRAPRWIQQAGFEWLYRLSHEPRRLTGRYARDAGWLFVLAARVMRSRNQVLPAMHSTSVS